MVSYRIRRPSPTDEIPTFLLPLSFGISSTSLVFLLDAQRRAQREKVSRTHYKVKIVHIDERILDPGCSDPAHLDVIRKKFPDLGEYECASLEDIYDYNDAAAEVMEGVECAGDGGSKRERLCALLSALPSPTSRMDLASIIRNRLLVEIAKRESCEGILWGDTTTKLAEKTLAETAKGRGFSLPWMISDGLAPHGSDFSFCVCGKTLLTDDGRCQVPLPVAGCVQEGAGGVHDGNPG